MSDINHKKKKEIKKWQDLVQDQFFYLNFWCFRYASEHKMWNTAKNVRKFLNILIKKSAKVSKNQYFVNIR